MNGFSSVAITPFSSLSTGREAPVLLLLLVVVSGPGCALSTDDDDDDDDDADAPSPPPPPFSCILPPPPTSSSGNEGQCQSIACSGSMYSTLTKATCAYKSKRGKEEGKVGEGGKEGGVGQ